MIRVAAMLENVLQFSLASWAAPNKFCLGIALNAAPSTL